MNIFKFQEFLYENVKAIGKSTEIISVEKPVLFSTWQRISPKGNYKSRMPKHYKKKDKNGNIIEVDNVPEKNDDVCSDIFYDSLKELWEYLNKRFVGRIIPVYSGLYKKNLVPWSYRTIDRTFKNLDRISLIDLEEKQFSLSTLYFSYALFNESQNYSFDCGNFLDKVVDLCVEVVYGKNCCREIYEHFYKICNKIHGIATEEKIKNFPDTVDELPELTVLYALLIAATQRCCFDTFSETEGSIDWFFNLDDSIPHINEETMISNSDYNFVEQKIIHHIWRSNRLIFDQHPSFARRENVVLSDYYVVPTLSCLNDKSSKFILDRVNGSPIRASLCAPSGFGKSTLFLAILYCSTLDKAVEYGIVSSTEERAYRALQKELVGENEVFPQFLPVVVTGSAFSSSKSDDFISLFSQQIFPIDDNTPEPEIVDKKRWQNILKEMIENRVDHVLFFCDAFDECESTYRERYVEKFSEIVNHTNKYNILLSYRPFCDEGRIRWKEYKKWTILPLTSWGIDRETKKDKSWLMVRKTTDSIVIFDADESDRYTNLIYNRMHSSPVLKVFFSSPYLISTYVALCVDNKGGYHERTVYEMVRDVVNRIFTRFNPDKEYELDSADFKEICSGIALSQIKKKPYAIMPMSLSDVFCDVVKEKYKGQDKIKSYFTNQIKCEDINSKSGVLILNDDRSGYVFQANAATLPYLASLEFFSIIYKIVQDAEDSWEYKEPDERKIMYELRQVLEWLNEEHYVFIPLLIARIYDDSADTKIGKQRRKKICQLILDCADRLDIPDMSETLRDRSFARTVFSEESD